MSTIDHNPTDQGAGGRGQATEGPGASAVRIGVRALFSAPEHRPQVALRIPGVGHQVRLNADDAADLAARLISTAHMARYDAAVYAALEQAPVAPDVRAAALATLVVARERLAAQGLGSGSRPEPTP